MIVVSWIDLMGKPKGIKRVQARTADIVVPDGTHYCAPASRQAEPRVERRPRCAGLEIASRFHTFPPPPMTKSSAQVCETNRCVTERSQPAEFIETLSRKPRVLHRGSGAEQYLLCPERGFRRLRQNCARTTFHDFGLSACGLRPAQSRTRAGPRQVKV
jgi:hypothetical protein